MKRFNEMSIYSVPGTNAFLAKDTPVWYTTLKNPAAARLPRCRYGRTTTEVRSYVGYKHNDHKSDSLFPRMGYMHLDIDKAKGVSQKSGTVEIVGRDRSAFCDDNMDANLLAH